MNANESKARKSIHFDWTTMGKINKNITYTLYIYDKMSQIYWRYSHGTSFASISTLTLDNYLCQFRDDIILCVCLQCVEGVRRVWVCMCIWFPETHQQHQCVCVYLCIHVCMMNKGYCVYTETQYTSHTMTPFLPNVTKIKLILTYIKKERFNPKLIYFRLAHA